MVPVTGDRVADRYVWAASREVAFAEVGEGWSVSVDADWLGVRLLRVGGDPAETWNRFLGGFGIKQVAIAAVVVEPDPEAGMVIRSGPEVLIGDPDVLVPAIEATYALYAALRHQENRQRLGVLHREMVQVAREYGVDREWVCIDCLGAGCGSCRQRRGDGA